MRGGTYMRSRVGRAALVGLIARGWCSRGGAASTRTDRSRTRGALRWLGRSAACVLVLVSFGRFRTYLGATTRCLLFAGTGGVFTQRANSPPVIAVFYFLVLFFHTITNVRPRPPKPYIIVSRDRLSTGGTFFVVNVRFFIDS